MGIRASYLCEMCLRVFAGSPALYAILGGLKGAVRSCVGFHYP